MLVSYLNGKHLNHDLVAQYERFAHIKIYDLYFSISHNTKQLVFLQLGSHFQIAHVLCSHASLWENMDAADILTL